MLGILLILWTELPAQEIVRLTRPGGILEGTLQVPVSIAGASPLVILIAGSGPTDRDGNQPQGGAATLKVLADSLSRMGLPSFRYDKRMIGASVFPGQTEEDFRFDTSVVDLVAWIDHWFADGRFDPILLAGHSEGSLVAILAASKRPQVRGLISLAGAGRPADSLMMVQFERQPEFVRVAADSLFRQLRAGLQVEPPEILMALFRPSVQPYLRSWMMIDPAQEIGRLDIPVLIVQGGADIQVFGEDADRLERGSRFPSSLRLPEMNHVLRSVDGLSDNLNSYGQPDRPLVEGLVPGIRNWVQSVTAIRND